MAMHHPEQSGYGPEWTKDNAKAQTCSFKQRVQNGKDHAPQ